ncbi:MAG: hypothetical protein KF729_38890, partial [Sandaracinaceae bacterium]|nr:hypothetical protein [Sandaracinaceae bacterium]
PAGAEAPAPPWAGPAARLAASTAPRPSAWIVWAARVEPPESASAAAAFAAHARAALASGALRPVEHAHAANGGWLIAAVRVEGPDAVLAELPAHVPPLRASDVALEPPAPPTTPTTVGLALASAPSAPSAAQLAALAGARPTFVLLRPAR